jgi:hypothetical protein
MRTTGKPFSIDKRQVYEAYKAVKSNAGSAGVDGQTIEPTCRTISTALEWNELGKRYSREERSDEAIQLSRFAAHWSRQRQSMRFRSSFSPA